MLVSIMQPSYLPWIGYYHRILLSDLHIILDDVDIDKNSKTNFVSRNKIISHNGWSWLSVPIKTRSSSGTRLIRNIEIDNEQRWREKHHNAIRMNYSKTRYFADQQDFIDKMYSRPWHNLYSLTQHFNEHFLNLIGSKTEIVESSVISAKSKKSGRILELCQRVGATKYLSGPFGKGYLDLASFENAGVEVIFHDFKHPVYSQNKKEFVPNLSAIDLLFRAGLKTRDVILGEY